MYHTLLGPEGFRKGMDLYFKRHDGQVTDTHSHTHTHCCAMGFRGPVAVSPCTPCVEGSQLTATGIDHK